MPNVHFKPLPLYVVKKDWKTVDGKNEDRWKKIEKIKIDEKR